MNISQGTASTADARKAATVSCPSCGGSITLRALGQSVMTACPWCRTQLDISRPDIQIIRKYREKASQLRIPLGTRGTLRKQMYEVVGAMQRSVSGYRWQEYLLFNPYAGFRWLVFDSGHWNFGRMLKESVATTPQGSVEFEGRRYAKFQVGKPVVDWVIGEFYWRVSVGDTVTSSDYIAPPFMLSQEKNWAESTWTLLEYIEPGEIEAAFSIESPSRNSIAPNQPGPGMLGMRKVFLTGFAALALALAIQVATVIRAKSSAVPIGTYSFSQEKAEQVYGPFTFDAPFSLNELTASAGLSNSWVELDCTLVNTDTGEKYEFTNAFSYYYGTDSDGSWSEGSGKDTSIITRIPAGTYNLVVEGASGDNSNQRINESVNLSMTHDVVPWRNFWIVLLAIIAYPLYLLYRSVAFEKQRWSASDFNPDSPDSD